MGKRHRVVATLVKERNGKWAVRIDFPDGSHNWARPGTTQRVVYDEPENVPRHLRLTIVPSLIHQARLRNLTGE